MNYTETQLLVSEIKGLLHELERTANCLNFNIASDNVHRVTEGTNYMKAIIERIETKVSDHYATSKKNDVDEWI